MMITRDGKDIAKMPRLQIKPIGALLSITRFCSAIALQPSFAVYDLKAAHKTVTKEGCNRKKSQK